MESAMDGHAAGSLASSPTGAPGTVANVLEAYHGLRAAITELFEAVGVDAAKTRESARSLGLNRGLAWRVTRIVRSANDPAVISDVPGRQSMSRMLEACRTLGAPDQGIARTEAAIDRYEEAVRSCSDDRKTLAMVLSHHVNGVQSIEPERGRRKLFEGAASVWGVRAEVRFVTVFAFPSPDDPTRIDAGHVTGYVGFRRLSARAWPLFREAVHDADGKPRPFEREPLSGSVGDDGLGLLNEFCDPAAPEIEISEGGGFRTFELAAGPVGNRGLTTCVFGTRLRHLYPRYATTPDTAGFMVLLQTPTKHLVFDMFVHRDLKIGGMPRVELLDRLTFPHGNDEREFPRQLMPIAEQPTALPPGIDGAVSPAMPWYPRLLRSITSRIEQPFEAFEGSRLELAYPPIATVLSRRFDLHPPPE
ncbi:MAG: hypothetical protein KDA22_02200 [Phycisphaerales bacterium]|nr:hypothetical protein [Phycisphaerales bacterium]